MLDKHKNNTCMLLVYGRNYLLRDIKDKNPKGDE